MQRELAAAIVRRAHEFTLPALLDALAALGLRSEEIEFRSHLSQAHHAFLIHGVQLQDDPRRAFVALNIGLVAAQSPLPSYFFSILDEGGDNSDAVLAFLGLFDHPLLRERARAEYPERNRRVVSDWEQDKALILSLMALQSPSSLHWLFQRIYPELGVKVCRRVKTRTLATSQVIMGAFALGEAREAGQPRRARFAVRVQRERRAHASTERVVRQWSDVDRPPSQWWSIPAVRRRWNVLVSGSEDEDFPAYALRRHIGSQPGLRALSLGCGSGGRELRWCELGAFEHIDAFERRELAAQHEYAERGADQPEHQQRIADAPCRRPQLG